MFLSRDLVDQKAYDTLIRIGNKEQLVEDQAKAKSMLVQLLFAYLYDWRTMDFERSCESAWTICKLCPFLSGFVYHSSMTDTLINLYRRVMIYPIYRHFKLAEKIQQDLQKLLEGGRLLVLKIVLEVKMMFERSEPRYMFNILYIDDLVVYAQTLEDPDYRELLEQVAKVKVKKSVLNLMLEEFEEEGLEMEPD